MPPASVACLVPVRAPAPWLGEALDSILAQEPAPAEVIVIDDASSDPLCLPAEVEARCRLVRLDEPGGPAAARDAGLAGTSAALVALCDADDAWLPGRLAAGLRALEREPGAAVCFGRAVIVDESGEPSSERWPEPAAGPLDPDAFVAALYEHNPIPASSALVRRSELEAAGGFGGPAPLASDWDLWLRLAARGARFVCEPDARVRYRRHGRGVTADVAALAESQLAVHTRHAELVPEETWARVRASDLNALARGLVRHRRYAHARDALREAASLVPPAPRERALAAILAMPGARALLGRRAPYGG